MSNGACRTKEEEEEESASKVLGISPTFAHQDSGAPDVGGMVRTRYGEYLTPQSRQRLE